MGWITYLTAPSLWKFFVDPTKADRVKSGKVAEDCLLVDIYRPRGVSDAEIMFFIHGGQFISGSSHLYEGIELAKLGSISVVTQYRLSIFGFLSQYDEEEGHAIGGNFGLMDQLEALKFTSKNAKNLGGDANKVLIYGQSAGGMSVGLHMLNNESS